jgi:thiol:disulfide interchange protein DsbD
MSRILLLLGFLAAVGTPAFAQIDFAPKVQARLIAEQDEIAPGTTVAVALEENIRPGWHTYWRNPGDAGAPTDIKWSLPKGWQAGDIAWPTPKELPVGPLMDFGYEGAVWLLTTLHVPTDAKPGSVLIKAKASWLVCKEICIPEDAQLSLSLGIGPAPSPPYPNIAAQFAAARAKLPQNVRWPSTFAWNKGLAVLIWGGATPPFFGGGFFSNL